MKLNFRVLSTDLIRFICLMPSIASPDCCHNLVQLLGPPAPHRPRGGCVVQIKIKMVGGVGFMFLNSSDALASLKQMVTQEGICLLNYLMIVRNILLTQGR